MTQGRADYRYRAQRPGLTALFLGGAALWAGCAMGYGGCRTLELAWAVPLAVASGLASLILGVLCALRWRTAACMALAVGMAGCALGLGAGAALRTQADALAQRPLGPLEILILEDSQDHGFGESALARFTLQDGTSFKATLEPKEGEPLLFGQSLAGQGRFERADHGDDAFAWGDGSCGTVALWRQEERTTSGPLGALAQVRGQAVQALGNLEASAVLQAVVCGYRRNIQGTESYRSYQACGVAHLIAVSGAHLVIVTGLAAAALKALHCPRRLAIAFLVGLMGAYLMFAALPLSALRAVIMSSVGILALLGRRRPSSVNALGLAMAGVVLCDPAASLSVSFALSALSTAGIVLFAPLIQGWLRGTVLDRLRFASDGLSLTLASGLLSQLYACTVFSLLPLASPLANILCAPLFPVVCGLGLSGAMAAVAHVPAAPLLLGAADLAARALNGLIALLAAMPFASVPFACPPLAAFLVTAAAAGALWLLWPTASQMAAVAAPALAMAVVIWALPTGGDRIVMLDVGQGDAILIQSRGRSLLVDTGNRDTLLLQGLSRHRVTALDAVLITHGDDDHCGSLDALRTAVEVDALLLAQGTWDCTEDNARDLLAEAQLTAPAVKPLAAGDQLRLGAFTATVLWPREFTDGGGNGDSLCLWLEYDGDNDGTADCTALLTGDAEAEQLAAIMESPGLPSPDILKVGHHGSRNALTAEQVRALHPKVALIGVGEGNRYGHPHQETLDALEATGCQVMRTDQQGDVVCDLGLGRVDVSTVS